MLVGSRYERSHATRRNGKVVVRPTRNESGMPCYSSPAAPVHVNVGSGGAGELGNFKGKPVLTYLAGAPWSAARLTSGYGYVQVTVNKLRAAGDGEPMERLICQYIDVGEQRWQAWEQRTGAVQPESVADAFAIEKRSVG